jgi:hypothetical protein
MQRFDRRTFQKMMLAIPSGGCSALLPGTADIDSAQASTPGMASPKEVNAPWYVTNRRWTCFNAHFQAWDPEIASRFDAREIVRWVAKANANVFWMFAMDHIGHCYYPTRTGKMHPNLKNAHFLAQIVEECRRYGIASVLYSTVSWNRNASYHHPEWVMKDNKNQTPDFDSVVGPILCYNSGYLDFMKAIGKELAEFRPDGIFFDMMWYGTSGKLCYCQANCQPLFRKKYGIDMPLEPTWDDDWRKWLEFRYESNLRFGQELSAAVRSAEPGLSIGYNYHGQPPFSWEVAMRPVSHCQIGDYNTGEAMPNWQGHGYPSLVTTFARGARPNAPTMMATSKCVRGYTDYTLRPELHLKWEVFLYFAHGAHAFVIDDALFDGTIQPQTYERLGRVFAEVKEKEPYFGHEHVREVGLYYSFKSRDWYGREKPALYENAFMGAYRALNAAHIPVDAIFDESVTSETLAKYPLILLANTAILDDNELGMLRGYVKGGGRLIATQDTSLYDLNGKALPDFALEDVLGIRYRSKADYSWHYFALAGGDLATGIPAGYDVLVQGAANIVDVAGADTVGDLKVPFHDGPPFHQIGFGACNSAWKRVGPAVVLNRYGAGQTAYISFGPDVAYGGDFPLPEHRLIIRNLVRHLHPTPAIQVEAPTTTEVVVTNDRAGSRYIIHFVECRPGLVMSGTGSSFKPNVMEDPPLYRARILLQQHPRTVTTLSHTTQLNQKERVIDLQIEEVHEAVIISY